jgi:hypothetical protein
LIQDENPLQRRKSFADTLKGWTSRIFTKDEENDNF